MVNVAVLPLKFRLNELFSYNTPFTWLQVCLVFICERSQIGPVCTLLGMGCAAVPVGLSQDKCGLWEGLMLICMEFALVH